MKVYIGEVRGTFRYQVRVRDGGESYFLEPRHDLRNHSPDGFSWGFGGSGPAQLALAMLADITQDDEFAQRHYQDWKREYVANLDIDGDWRLVVNGGDPLSMFLARVSRAIGVEARP